jgi:hypothetical protein
VVGILDEVPRVMELVVVPAFAIHLESAAREYPPEKKRHELIIGPGGIASRKLVLEEKHF